MSVMVHSVHNNIVLHIGTPCCPCLSYSRRRDRINSVLWRSYYKGGGVCGTCKLRPCPSYNRRWDRINLGLFRSYWGNVSAQGARRASFVTRAPPVDCCR